MDMLTEIIMASRHVAPRSPTRPRAYGADAWRFIHFAKSSVMYSVMYEEPLSDSSLGRCSTLALSSPEASSANSSVAAGIGPVRSGAPLAGLEHGRFVMFLDPGIAGFA